MLRTILATVAVAAMAGGAVAQYVPSDAGLTPGAPVGRDPVTGDPIRAGETDPVIADEFAIEERIEERSVFLPTERRAAEMPRFEGPTPPSDAGLTPGAPVGEGWNDNKVVAD